MDFFDDNHSDELYKPHFDHNGNLKGFTQKDIITGEKKYFDENGTYKGSIVKNFNGTSDYFDASNKYLGSSLGKVFNHEFLNADGTLGHSPKMFDIKDPDFHNTVHNQFSAYRDDLLSKIK